MKYLAAALLAGLVWFLLPRDALAWGPLTHADWSLRLLAGLTAVAAPLRRLLERRAGDFLYGSLAADIVLGKNLARYDEHVHNWDVAFRVLRGAQRQGDDREAFALGMLSHLAADTVAHNYYVPWKLVESFDVPGTGHAFWELRMDETRPDAVWSAVRELDRRDHRHHEELLRATWTGQVLPWGVNQGWFGAMFAAVRLPSYRRVVALGLRRRRLPPRLERAELRELESMCVRAVRGLLRDLDGAPVLGADPAGLRNLAAARALRRQLRARVRAGELTLDEARELAARARRSFKAAIGSPLVLPQP